MASEPASGQELGRTGRGIASRPAHIRPGRTDALTDGDRAGRTRHAQTDEAVAPTRRKITAAREQGNTLDTRANGVGFSGSVGENDGFQAESAVLAWPHGPIPV